jgi:hypothetical protein
LHQAESVDLAAQVLHQAEPVDLVAQALLQVELADLVAQVLPQLARMCLLLLGETQATLHGMDEEYFPNFGWLMQQAERAVCQ